MAEALRQVVRAASTDDARAVLTGVLITAEDDGVRMVATDSYRLAVRDLPESEMLASGQKVLVPSRALNELQRVLGHPRRCKCASARATPCSRPAATRLTTRLIEGEYPNYRNLLPSAYPNTITVGRERCSRPCGGSRSWPRTPRRCACTSVARRCGSAPSPRTSATPPRRSTPSYEGTEMTVAFNPDYLAAGVDAIDAEEVTLSTMDPMKPAVIRAVGRDDYLYLLMPVRVP